MPAIINSPAALDLLTQVQLRFYDGYGQLYKGPEYSDYEKFVYPDDPAGDLIDVIYAEPGQGMREWKDARPMEQIDFQHFQASVRRFANGMKVDLDDIKPDSGNPAKLKMYLMAVEQLVTDAALLWPGLVAEAIVAGLTKKWLPDGQMIWDLHNYKASDASVGTFRNYYASSAQGGSAAMPLTYPNLLARLEQGYGFKLPNGKDKPIRYTHLCVPPSSFPKASRLTKFDRLPVGEVLGQDVSTTSAGGDTENQIRSSYAVEPVMLAGMKKNTWLLADASSPASRGIALKKREEIKWQQLAGPGASAVGMSDNDSGVVSAEAFDDNSTKWGPKARGEAFFRNWWGQMYCDGNA